MYAIGIDVGGTSIKGAAVNEKGEMLDTFSLSVIRSDSGEVTLNKLVDVINAYIEKNNLKDQIVGIGMGVPGAIDSINGICKFSNNLLWYSVPVKDIIEKGTGYKVRIANDADSAAFGEACFGAGKDYNSTVTITLGTGVGGGVVIDKKLYLGNGGMGMELGHMVIVLNGRQCTCGRKGCFEAYASATALIADTKAAMAKYPDSLLHKYAELRGDVTGRVPFQALADGDKAAEEVIDQYIYFLGEGLCNICNLYRPDAILLSGGIANAGDALFSRLRKYMSDSHFGFEGYPNVDIMPTKLGYQCGIIGAACLFLR